MTDKRDRNKQFEIVEGLFTWYDDIMNHYEASFWVHYHILDRIINIWIEEVKNNSDIPRVMYFVNTEYMSMVLCELLLTVETLFKAELVKAGFEEKLLGHSLIDLMDKMAFYKDHRCQVITAYFNDCRPFFSEMDSKHAFANARYLDYGKVMLDSESASDIKMVVCALDEVYHDLYSEFDVGRLLYLGMMLTDIVDLSDDEEIRLRKLMEI